MAAPPIITPPPPAINKTYSDIKFFVKNADTTKAFSEIPFTGTADGYPSLEDPEVLIPYPNETFDNENTGVYPYIDLINLSNLYELKVPINLGTGTVSGNTVTGDGDIFTNIETKTYLLYRDAEESYLGYADGLKVLGYVVTKNSDSVVVLSTNVPVDLETMNMEIFSWEGDENLTTLNNFNFSFKSNFYMVVKNADYTLGNHDAVLLIDITRNSTNYTSYPQPFAYSNDRIINPNYFSFQRISKVYKPLESEEVAVNIPCSIKAISKYSEKAMFENFTEGIPTGEIPYWSVYEISPQLDSFEHLDKKTFYRLTVKDSLPSSRVYVNV